jgi:hypothetical protein
MSDTQGECGFCRLPIHAGETLEHFGFFVAHSRDRCVYLLKDEIERLKRDVDAASKRYIDECVRCQEEHDRAEAAERDLAAARNQHTVNGRDDASMADKRDAERYYDLCTAIRGVHIEPGARDSGIYTYALQITEPIPVMVEGDLTVSQISAAIDAAMRLKPPCPQRNIRKESR